MNDTEDVACPVNLNRAGVRQRAVAGSVAALVGFGLGAYAVIGQRAWPWRLAALALFCFGALALLQARAQT